MKTIKLKFVGFWQGVIPQNTLLWRTLSKHFRVELSDKPDYIICSGYDLHMGFAKYPQVRIFSSGENFAPDFNLVDYAISNYPIEFQDRAFCMPQLLSGYSGERMAYFLKPRQYDASFLQSKTRFANFIASHESEYGIRGAFMKKLSEYKRVDSAGTYLNNMPDGTVVNWKDDSKVNFQRTCKFSLCFESTSQRGFCTEKLTDAFFAETIPVYYGDPDAVKIFNPKAFINCNDYATFDEAIERIKALDKDDEAYLAMMNEPVFLDPNYIPNKLEAYERFLCNIFEQPLEKAYRRTRVALPQRYNEYLVRASWLFRPINRVIYAWQRFTSKIKKRRNKVWAPYWFATERELQSDGRFH